jgi:UDP-N-acetylmuramoyl-tripeptide--D-alanyl-D-alanine ligase
VALQDLARNWRAQFDTPVVVVTGSNGKTTVKEMLAAIMQAAYGEGYLATRGNLNNDIGLPLTLLNLNDTHQSAVIELGMNHPGETAQLAPIAQPTIAIINNAQREHQEFMQTVEAVALEHADVIDSIVDGGVVVFPADDAYASIWRERAQARGIAVHDFSLNESVSAMYSARYELGLYASTVQLVTPMGQCTTQINTPGVHNVHNALAACAAVTAMGLPLEVVATGLANFVPAKGRLQTHQLGADCILIDDTYNANPDSVLAAIEVLANSAGRKILVLGDMGEVGEDGGAFHAEIGAHAAQRGVNVLLATGEMMRQATQAFGAGAQHFDDVAGIANVVRAHMQNGANTVLVKGSRFMGMERVVDELLLETAQNMQDMTIKDTSDAT